MSWERPDFTQYAHHVDVVRVSVSRHKGRSLRIAVGRNIWRKLGWSKGRRCEIEYGTGSDEGWLRITLVESGRTKIMFCNSKARDGSMILKTNRYIPKLKVGMPNTVCKHIVTPGDDLLIKLPQEFWEKYEPKKPYTPKIALRQGNAVDKSVENHGSTNIGKKNGHLTV